MQNCDELFDREEFSAAPDVSWPDCFNSGVFVFRPSEQTFQDLLQFTIEQGSFDGGDQGLLNQYFNTWRRLPFAYNVPANAAYCYLPAFYHYRHDIKVLHFAGRLKPWLLPCHPRTHLPSIPSEYVHAADYLRLWWKIFFEGVHQHLDEEMVSNASKPNFLHLFLCCCSCSDIGKCQTAMRLLPVLFCGHHGRLFLLTRNTTPDSFLKSLF